MKTSIKQMWKDEDGSLSFEWVMLVTVLVIGVVSGVTGARDAVIDEMGDVAQAMLALDQSYLVDGPLAVSVHVDSSPASASDSSFTDAAAYTDCARTTSPPGQISSDDIDS